MLNAFATDPDHHSVGFSLDLNPAFKFVLVFIALLLSYVLKAVRVPIVSTPNSIAPDARKPLCGEEIRDQELADGIEPLLVRQPPATIRKDSLGLNG